jgi:hypothetical protein
MTAPTQVESARVAGERSLRVGRKPRAAIQHFAKLFSLQYVSAERR